MVIPASAVRPGVEQDPELESRGVLIQTGSSRVAEMRKVRKGCRTIITANQLTLGTVLHFTYFLLPPLL